MSVMTKSQFSKTINGITKSREVLQATVQEALITATYYAMKDGNAEPFNQICDAVGSAVYLKGITLWAETYAPVIVKDGSFVLNKKAAKEHNVLNEDDFAPIEAEIRQGVAWYDIAPRQRAVSMFEPSGYLSSVAKKLEREGFPELANEMKRVASKYGHDLIAAVEAVKVED